MTPTAEHEPTREALKTRGLWGWLSVVVNFGYTVFGYYGFAPPPGGMPTDWWHGRTYILDFESMGGYVDNPLMGAFLFALPAIGVCLATFLSSRSAIARMLSLSLALTSTLFAVAGYAAASPWELFSWRFTAVLALTGLSLAAAVVAPLLVASWLRLSSRARCIVYLPIFFCTMAAVRGATGTSEHLMFMISPWPLFTTMCLDDCVLVVAGFLFSVALGVVSVARRKVDIAAVVGVLAALWVPGFWVARACTSIGLPELAIGTAGPSALLAAALIAACSIDRQSRKRRETALKRGFHLGLGATLVFVPVFAGHSLAAGDYAVNRFVRAPQVIHALQQHIMAEEFYPETLDDLVKAGYLSESPRPRIGFGFLEKIGLADEVKYRYNEYGSSFILEFDSNYWVQCAYSGNYYFDEDEEEYEAEELQEDAPDWTCLNKTPMLFDAGVESEDEYENKSGYEDE